MEIANIIKRVNAKLDGETLTYPKLEIHLDSTIDDINARLSSKYPVFSEFTSAEYSESKFREALIADNPLFTEDDIVAALAQLPVFPNYLFFPEKFIRTVVIPGTAWKFYVKDEEGLNASPAYEMEYAKGLFEMERDFINNVPLVWRNTTQGYLQHTTDKVRYLTNPRWY